MALGGLNLLVHSLFPMSAIIRMYSVRAARRLFYSSPVGLLEILPKGNEAAALTVLSTLNMPRHPALRFR